MKSTISQAAAAAQQQAVAQAQQAAQQQAAVAAQQQQLQQYTATLVIRCLLPAVHWLFISKSFKWQCIPIIFLVLFDA